MKRMLAVAVLVAFALVTSGTERVLAQDNEKSAVEATVRDLEQSVQDYNHAKVNSLFTPEARWIEGSLPRKIEDEWQLIDKLKAAGIRIAYRLHDFETHVQGDVAWVTVTLDSTFSADSAEGQKLLPHKDEGGCIVGKPCESRTTYVESEVLVKTPSGWKIALGHTSLLPKAQK
ncbi:MAG: nuclear transport factor 2 family protein [Terriglobales bacterium]